MKTVQATLLVGDLRDFTRHTPPSSRPRKSAAMLRRVVCRLRIDPEAARCHDATKFIGDGVFAYWSRTDDKTRTNAMEAAQLLSRPEACQSPTRKWVKDNLGIEVKCHVGLHVGEVALGAMGRGVNTAVGEAVNVTFRIESLTRKLETPVLVSSDFAAGWKAADDKLEFAGSYPLKGQPDPIRGVAIEVRVRAGFGLNAVGAEDV